MPLTSKIEEKDHLVCVWELNETENDLLEIVTNQKIPYLHLVQNVNLTQKRRERLAALICINKALGENAYYEIGENGKPFLKNLNQHISISNTGGKVAVLFSKHNCGIDYQKKTGQLVRILNKFANENEQKIIANFDTPIDLIHWIWCSKEAIYKKHNKKGLSLKHDMKLKEITTLKEKINLTFEVNLEGRILEEKTDCTLLQEFYMTYTCN
ncbi:MAG: 4'-phosphopantetheinyl transferase superfamily protein [Bacteroidota bacterium]